MAWLRSGWPGSQMRKVISGWVKGPMSSVAALSRPVGLPALAGVPLAAGAVSASASTYSPKIVKLRLNCSGPWPASTV